MFFQDKESTELLENNGKWSSGKRTRHINIRFLKDQVKSGEGTIEHCPIEQMWAGYFANILQGSKFSPFRTQAMKLKPGKYI